MFELGVGVVGVVWSLAVLIKTSYVVGHPVVHIELSRARKSIGRGLLSTRPEPETGTGVSDSVQPLDSNKNHMFVWQSAAIELQL